MNEFVLLLCLLLYHISDTIVLQKKTPTINQINKNIESNIMVLYFIYLVIERMVLVVHVQYKKTI